MIIKKKIKHKTVSLLLPHLPVELYNFGFSGAIMIEPTNYCNLRCPLCSTPGMKRKRGFMTFEQFKNIVDENRDIFKKINMVFAGEPLLNENVFKMAKYAEEKGIATRISTNTTLLGRYIDQALDSGLSFLTVCLDGATKKAHEKNRKGSRFETVVENIRNICREKERRNLKKPQITLQFLVIKHNEHQIEAITKLANELGVDALHLKTIWLGSHIGRKEILKRAKIYLPTQEKLRRFKLVDGGYSIKSKPDYCPWLKESVIFWNGDVTLCCYDYEGELVVGNVFKDGGFKKVWKSKKYKEYRKAAVKRKFSLCKNCQGTFTAAGINLKLKKRI